MLSNLKNKTFRWEKDKKRIPLMVGSNTNGSEKLKLLIISKFLFVDNCPAYPKHVHLTTNIPGNYKKSKEAFITHMKMSISKSVPLLGAIRELN